MADVEEEIEEVRDAVEGEAEEERAREDEVTHYDDSKVLDAIADLSEKLDGIRDMVSAFVESGGVVSEQLNSLDDEPETLEEIFADEVKDEIDEAVIDDIANVKFSDDREDEE